jgi:geranylgeranyl diphosphate synthase type II
MIESAQNSKQLSILDLHAKIETRLMQTVPRLGVAFELIDAGPYAVQGPASRTRAILSASVGLDCGADEDIAIDVGCAVEILHCVSLILDDLPSMDNAAERRGARSHHAAFGQAATILTALALFNGVINALSTLALPSQQKLLMIETLTGFVHPDGAISGQLLDLAGSQSSNSNHNASHVHHLKAAHLFELACVLGIYAGNGAGTNANLFRSLGHHLGMLYQILDDARDLAQDSRGNHGSNIFNSHAGKDARLLWQSHLEVIQQELAYLSGGYSRDYLSRLVKKMESELDLIVGSGPEWNID